MRIFYSAVLAVVLIPAVASHAQSAGDRAVIAANMQSEFRSEGCSGCRVWVSGPENRKVEILDTEAERTPNDYDGRPMFWYNAGFRTVIYYSRPGVVYAKHTLETDLGPAKTAADKAAARREACKGISEVFGRTAAGCSHVDVPHASKPTKAPAPGSRVGPTPSAAPSAADPVALGKDWISAPTIQEIRRLYQRLERDIATGNIRLIETRSCDNVSADVYRNRLGTVAKLSLHGQTEHLSGQADYYYEHGRLRFSFRWLKADNGTHQETRTYFSQSGQLIHRDDRRLAGPGYPGGYDVEIHKPEQWLRSCASA